MPRRVGIRPRIPTNNSSFVHTCGITKLQDIKMTEKIENVTFIPRQPMKNIGRFLALGDILLVHLIDIPIYRMQMPSKLIAYMACAKPILCAMEGTAPKLINDACAGVTCAPSDPVAISSSIKQVYLKVF